MAQPNVAMHLSARIGSKALIREINEALVLDVVRRRGVSSRADITSLTGLSPATVTGISNQLVGEGMLVERDLLRGTGGRPARLLELGSDAVLAAGVRLSGDVVDATLVDLRGDVVATATAPLPVTDPDSAAEAVAAAVAEVASGVPAGSTLRGTSIALSGIVDRARGVVRHSGAFDWQDVPFAELVSARTGGRVLVDNLVNSLATGLLLLDDDLMERDIIVFSAGASLGVSVLIQGRIHRGNGGAAGGFAHSALGLRSASRLCHCGDVGCLETWSSVWGMRRELERRGLDAGDLSSPAGAEVVRQGGEHLGVAIANAAKMFAPERVVLALSEELASGDFLDACRASLMREYRNGESSAPDLIAIPANGNVFARGAGYDMITELFSADRSMPPA